MNQNKFRLASQADGPEYVDIHGRDIRVVIDEKTGEILIPLNEVKATGFTIYPKSQYNKLLVDDKQFSKEFSLNLLKCAQTYILTNKISFSEADILTSIDNCRKILAGNKNSNSASHFLEKRSIEESPDGLQIICNTNKSSPLTKQNVFQNERRYSRSPVQKLNSPTPSQHDNSTESYKPLYKQPGTNRTTDSYQKSDNGFTTGYKSSDSNNFKQSRLSNGESSQTSNQRSPKCDPGDVVNNLHRTKRNHQQNGDVRSQKGDERSSKEPPQSILEENREHKVTVSFVEKRTVCWVQNLENLQEMADLFEKVDEQEKLQQVVGRPVLNSVYIAPDEGSWYRCKVVGLNPLKVFFLDYGNTEEVDQVKSIPEELVKLPYLAARVTFAESEYDPTLEDEIVIHPTKRFEDGTYLIRVKKDTSSIKSTSSQAENVTQNRTSVTTPQTQTLNTSPQINQQSPKPPKFITKPPPPASLQPNEIVAIIREDNGTLFLRTKESHCKLVQIESDLKNVKAIPLDSVSVGQLVLAKRPNQSGLSRATVTNVNGTVIKVDFLDYPESAKVSLNSLQAINETLSLQPVTFIKSPKLSGLKNKKINELGRMFIEGCIQERTKFKVRLDGEIFDLKLGDDSWLSTKLIIQAPKDRVMLADMAVLEPKLGTHKYMFGSFIDTDRFNLMAVNDDLSAHLEIVIVTNMDDSNPYRPVQEEICLGLFGGDEWYRCVVTRVVRDKYDVHFVDFGNDAVLTPKELRKITDATKVVPILGIQAKLVDLPSNGPETVEKLKSLIVEGDISDVNFKRFIDGNYEVTIPSIYERLNI